MSDKRQLEFYTWAVNTYGLAASNCRERALRFIEEAIEAAQAAGLDARDIYLSINRVYLRPKGDLPKEIGQAALTLDALAEANGLSTVTEADIELRRIKQFPPSYWKDRQNAKAAMGLGERV